MDLACTRGRDDLDNERMFALATVRLLEIVGESAARVPAAFRESLPEIPWSKVVGLRNRLIHGYDSVNHDIVWQVLTVDLPVLATSLESTLDRLDGEGA